MAITILTSNLERVMSAKHSCPKCGKPGVGFWQKQFLGPARATACSHCDARLTVALAPCLPIFAYIFVGPLIFRGIGMMGHGYLSYIGLAVFLLLPISLYQHFMLPLVIRS